MLTVNTKYCQKYLMHKCGISGSFADNMVLLVDIILDILQILCNTTPINTYPKGQGYRQ